MDIFFFNVVVDVSIVSLQYTQSCIVQSDLDIKDLALELQTFSDFPTKRVTTSDLLSFLKKKLTEFFVFLMCGWPLELLLFH